MFLRSKVIWRKRSSEALQAKLSPAERSQVTPQAYGKWLRPILLSSKRIILQASIQDFEQLKQSEQLYERAVELDPNFALAICALLEIGKLDCARPRKYTQSRREKVRSLAERALQLQPDLPEAHLALGFCYYYGDQNYDAALREFEIARRGLPNDAGVYMAIGAIQRRQGNWAESNANLEKAASA